MNIEGCLSKSQCHVLTTSGPGQLGHSTSEPARDTCRRPGIYFLLQYFSYVRLKDKKKKKKFMRRLHLS